MKMSNYLIKKAVSLITAAVLAVSVMAFPSFAEENADTAILPYYTREMSAERLAEYKEIRQAIINFEPAYVYKNFDSEDDVEFFKKAVDLFILYDSYTFNLQNIVVEVKNKTAYLNFEYKIDKETYKKGIEAANKAFLEVSATFKETDSTATKVKKIHDYVAKNIVYKLVSPDNHSIVGAFDKRIAKCDGYAKAFLYLCEKAGIECVYVIGAPIVNIDDYGHAWNKVKIGKNWYVVDVTSDDREGNTGFVVYDYFMISDSTYHREYTEIDDKIVTEPIAANSDNSYYQQKKMTAETAEAAVLMLQKQAAASKTVPFMLTVQLTNDAEFDKLLKTLQADPSLYTKYIKTNGKKLNAFYIAKVPLRTLHITISEKKK
jgi:transglutaminase-like putative cysteine protease